LEISSTDHDKAADENSKMPPRRKIYPPEMSFIVSKSVLKRETKINMGEERGVVPFKKGLIASSRYKISGLALTFM
jgi:hypothetical protein